MCWRSLAGSRPGLAKGCLLALFLGLGLLAAGHSLAVAPEGAAAPQGRILVLAADLAASLSPAQADMLDAALAAALSAKADLLLVRLDTPGGGVEVMRRMVAAILNAPVPVAVWVGPAGARAASGGVFLVAAATVAAMAPQTTIGSASPVGPGGQELEGTMDKKIKNDLESLLRAVAETRGRNAAWYARAVEKAENLTAAEAVQQRVVDMIATDRTDLLAQIGRRGLPTSAGVVRFAPTDVQFRDFEPGWWYGVLSWLLDPQIAYILLLGGMAGLFFELTTPGAILPGVVGGICLLLALYALSVLPTNAAGLLLLLFGALLFGLEVHVASYGLLGVAGVLCLFVGSMLLFRFQEGGGLPLLVILPTVAGVSAILGLGAWLAAKAQRSRPRSGLAAMVGTVAEVRFWEGEKGKVFVRGELWNARSRQPVAWPAGRSVVVTGVDGMTLEVAEDKRETPATPATPVTPDAPPARRQS